MQQAEAHLQTRAVQMAVLREPRRQRAHERAHGVALDARHVGLCAALQVVAIPLERRRAGALLAREIAVIQGHGVAVGSLWLRMGQKGLVSVKRPWVGSKERGSQGGWKGGEP
jgi:hypothetical protein